MPNIAENYTFVNVDDRNVSPQLVKDLLSVGADAWSSAMPDRGPDQMINMFNPDGDDRNRFVRDLGQYRKYSRDGNLIVAFSHDDEGQGQPIGYAIAKEDVSDGLKGRAIRAFSNAPIIRDHVFVAITQINVRSDHQGKGVGTRLLHDVLENFPGGRITSAYIFDENSIAIGWFMSAKRGFKLDPNPQEPIMKTNYFGNYFPPVAQYRYTGPPVQELTRPIK